ncbi:MAG: hypothetical protein H8D23_11615 [Candidatus Brocadiales bacterium]|nr:hypothetical protein [Candidatus Brocadiales bacterium]
MNWDRMTTLKMGTLAGYARETDKLERRDGKPFYFHKQGCAWKQKGRDYNPRFYPLGDCGPTLEESCNGSYGVHIARDIAIIESIDNG